jgi:integrase/recombinase XerD
VAENPDLQELPGKHITWQSLRVSFATLLFANGCAIRSVNELMLHRSLSSTARYTPIPVEDLRQVCRTAHPRA